MHWTAGQSFVASGLIPRLVPMIHLIYSPVHSGSDLTFFFKTPAGTERHLLNCAYNSWKPSQRFPACCIFFAPNPPSPPSLIHQWPPPPPCPPAPSSNQLNQTVKWASCPSGLFCPTLSCPCYLSRGQTLCSLPESLRNKNGEEKVWGGGGTGDEAEGWKESRWGDRCRVMRFPAAWTSRCCWDCVDSNTIWLFSHF